MAGVPAAGEFELRVSVYVREKAYVALVPMPLGYRRVCGAACPLLVLALLDEIRGGLCGRLEDEEHDGDEQYAYDRDEHQN